MLELALQFPLGVDSQTMEAGDKVAQQMGASEWLGPLAPVALSPFFGLATLSGIATYGPVWLQERSRLFGDSSPLNSPALFWTLAILALLTSLPRLSKVSKPVALAAEKLEAYSAVIILMAVRLLGSSAAGSDMTAPTAALGTTAEGSLYGSLLLHAGLSNLPVDIVMSLVAGLNVIVINAVKLFFELLVWLVPVPFIDAALEATNKSLCAGLMALYCYSPALATGLNLLLLIACAMVFGWVYRRVAFYKHVIAGPILAWLAPHWFANRERRFNAFCNERLGKLPRYASVTVIQHAPTEFELQGRWLWRRHSEKLANCQPSFESGLIIQTLRLVDSNGRAIELSHRRWVAGDAQFQALQNSLAAR